MALELLHEKVQEAVKKKGFKKLTDIQEKAIPIILSGKNALLIAPTGTGKTEAALLPVLSRMLEEGTEKPGIRVLYITPLRALNRDLLDRIYWWAEELGFTVGVRHGDTSSSERAKQAKKPPQILITTPETLQSILPAPKMGEHLKNVRYVIVDEIHELVQEKRGYQLSVALERLLAKTRREFQRIGLSATIGSPEIVASFLGGVGRKVEIVDVTAERKMELWVEYPQPTEKDVYDSVRLGLHPQVLARIRRMLKLLEEHEHVLTFVNTRSMAEQLANYFSLFHEKTDVHHASLSKHVRITAEREFKAGKITHLIATSSLELGIDIGTVDLVIQYGSPRQVTRIIQRVGRSGHRIGKVPKGVIIATDDLDFMEACVIVDFAKKHILEPVKPEEKPYDVLAHQIAGLAMDFGEIELQPAFELVRRAWPFRNLGFEEFVEVVRTLDSERLIRFDGNRIKKGRNTWRYYYENISMIPDEQKFFVYDVTTKKNVGTLDEDFVASYLSPGVVFVVRGRPWRVIEVREKEVRVEPAKDFTGAIPSWIGEQIPVEKFVAEEVFRRFEEFDLPFIEEQKKYFLPSPGRVFVEFYGGYVIIHVPLGSRGNAALSRFISAVLSSRFGIFVRAFSTPYAVVLETETPVSREEIKRVLETDPSVVRILLRDAIVRTNMFRWRFIHVARRFGLISRDVDYEKINVRRLIEAVFGSPIFEETLKEVFAEKLDVEAVQELLEKIREGRVKVEFIEGPTPLGTRVLSLALHAPELVTPEFPLAKILEIFKERLLEKIVTLYCIYCGFSWSGKVREIGLSCPKCGSPRAALIESEQDRKALEIYKTRGRKTKKVSALLLSADLIAEHGRKALIAMAATGVGPNKAAKILSRMYSDEAEFFKTLLEEERKYFRTRRFWKLR